MLKARSQDHGFFNHIWLEEGLSQSSIFSIVQDKQGFMWFATQDGLNRYDGRIMDHFNFKPFDKHSVSSDEIYFVGSDSNNLFVLNNKGLDKIDLSTLKIVNVKEQQSIDSKLIFFRGWALDNSLFLFSRKGLAKAILKENNGFDLEYCHFKDSTTSEKITVVYSLCIDNNKNIYAATNKGLFLQKKDEKVFTKLYNLLPANLFKSDRDRMYSAVAWKENKLYFTNSNTLFCLNLGSLKLNKISLGNYGTPSVILVDKLNKIWLGTSTNGLLVIKEKENDSLWVEKHFVKNTNSRFALQSNEITSLYQNQKSNDDIVWIGTRDAGVFNYSYSKNSFSIPTSFVNTTDPNFFGVVKDKDGVVWAGYNSGILKIDGLKKTQQAIDLSSIQPVANRPVQAICCDKQNNVWVAYGNCLYLIDKSKNVLIKKIDQLTIEIPNESSKIVALNKNELLICTSRGLIIYNKQTNATKKINSITVGNQKINLENVESFRLDSKFNWWIGTISGLYCLRQNGQNIFLKHNNNDSGSILSNRIMDINETENGQIIIATTKGLSLIEDYGKKIKNIYSAKGLSNNFVYGLLADNRNRFWLTTNFGISVFNPENLQFKSYTASDGICINEFNSGGFFKSDDGELIFAGLGGLVSFYPERQTVNRNVSDIVLRSIRIENYNEEIKLDKPLILSYSQNDIFLEFSIPDYSGQKNMELFYRFRNKDTAWIKVNPAQLFSLAFINIAPGDYNFEAIAINKEGAKSKPLSITFKINYPFWSTWWFYLILVLITGFSSWIIYRVRLKRKINYIEQIEQIRKDENEKVRKAAALDLHDEFGNGLTRISMLTEMSKIQITKENDDAHKLLELISQNSNRLYQGTKDFIWSINPGKDNLYEIAIRIKDYADELFYGTKIIFELDGLKEELKQIKQPPTSGRNIAMIFKESLANVLKHSKAGKVKFTVKQNSESIFLILEDDGIGFEMKDYKNSFGITNIQQRAGRLNSQVEILSTLNRGTKIVLVINLKNEENDNNNS